MAGPERHLALRHRPLARRPLVSEGGVTQIAWWRSRRRAGRGDEGPCRRL